MTCSTQKTFQAHDLRRFQLFAKLLCVWGLLLGALHSPALAQTVGTAFPSTVSGNTTTYSGGAYNRASVAAGAAMVVSGGAAAVAQNQAIRTAAGIAVAVVVRASPAVGAVRAALAACLNNPVCAVASAAAIAAAANEFNYRVNVDPITGSPTVTKNDPTVCTAAPCYEYKIDSQFGFSTIWAGSIAGVCSDYRTKFAAWKQATGSFATVTSCASYKAGNMTTATAYATTSNGAGEMALTRSAAPKPATPLPSTTDEVAQAIGSAVDGAPAVPLPAGSTVPAAVTQAVKNSDYSIGLGTPSVTGPATVAKPATTTTKSDGTVITSTGGIDMRYYGPSVDTTERTVETTTTPAGTTSSSTTTQPATAVPPDIDECATRPNSNGCRTDTFDTPAGEIPKSSKTIPFNVENTGFGSGQCPAPIKMNTSNGSYEINLAPYCDAMVNYVKPVLLLITAFAAFAICVPKGADI